MENFRLVRPEHLNHHGYLFGGVLLKWLDEFGWMAATLDFPGSTFVTVGMDEINFKKRIENGSILRFIIKPQRTGKTSVTYIAKVFTNQAGAQQDEVFTTKLTFVNIGENGKPAPLPTKCQYNSQKKENELLF
ncbi:thioesterase superfamily protein [Flexistipes sinusarabici DSM 4947]|uniref:Thioesterase superfamily protein n=2 Tax=Flexistipes sinusarabici TaxID=2352 RepID=F8E6S6_FLESM|nr:acyl-CoA thioesterase [Flexistipes sinusarabici]AEI13712.1 thioesterase superfamily protein [Flexistipes sinusarabici DSM 4947]